jgi:hypothetical protein
MHGVSDKLFIKHGMWQSVKAKGGYVVENYSEKLSVTHNLGIKKNILKTGVWLFWSFYFFFNNLIINN